MRRRFRPVQRNCFYCGQKKEPDYKEFDELSKFVSDRGKLLGKSRTGTCAKHQRRISIAVKRARHLGLLPFMVKLK